MSTPLCDCCGDEPAKYVAVRIPRTTVELAAMMDEIRELDPGHALPAFDPWNYRTATEIAQTYADLSAAAMDAKKS